MQQKAFPKVLGFHCVCELRCFLSVTCRKFSQPLLSTLKVIQQHGTIPLNGCLKSQLANSEAQRGFFSFLSEGGDLCQCCHWASVLSQLSMWLCPASQSKETQVCNCITRFLQGKPGCSKRWPWRNFPQSFSLSKCDSGFYKRSLPVIWGHCNISSSCKCLQTAQFVPVTLGSLSSVRRSRGSHGVTHLLDLF